MNSRSLAISATLWLGVALGSAASATTRVEQRVEIDLLVPRIQFIDVENTSFAAPTLLAADFDRGFFQFPDPLWVTVSSNSPWTLAVRRPPDDSVPIRLDELQLQDGTRILTVGAPWQTLARGEKTPRTSQPFHVRIPLSWSATVPGTYEPRFEYRLGPDRAYP